MYYCDLCDGYTSPNSYIPHPPLFCAVWRDCAPSAVCRACSRSWTSPRWSRTPCSWTAPRGPCSRACPHSRAVASCCKQNIVYTGDIILRNGKIFFNHENIFIHENIFKPMKIFLYHGNIQTIEISLNQDIFFRHGKNYDVVVTSPSAEAYKCPVSPRWQMSRMPPPSLSSWASITFLTFPNLNICPGPWLIVSTDPLCEAVSEASVVQTLVYNIFQTLKYASSAKLLKCYFYVIPLSNPLAIAMIDIFSSKFTFIPNICKRSKDSDLQTKHLAI